MFRTILAEAAMQARMAMWAVQDVLARKPSRLKDNRRRDSGFHRCSITNLEERICMSAAPWAPDIDRLAAYEFAEVSTPKEVRAGATDIAVANLFITNQFGTNDIRGLTVTGTGTTALQNVASRVTVWADLDNDPCATMETLIGAAVVRGNKVDIVLSQRLDTNVDTLAMQLRIDTKANANTASIGLDVTSIKATDERGRPVSREDIGLRDTNGSQVRVLQQDNVLILELSSPSSGLVSKGQQNAVLGTLRVGTTEGDALIRRLGIAVEARDAFGRMTANVGNELTGIELRNTVTGQVIGGTLKAQGTGYQVLTFGNFIARNGDEWEIRADIGGNASVRDGDLYRVLVNGAETGSTTFGGLTKSLGGVDLEAQDMDSGRRIVRSFPNGTLAANFQRIGQTTLNVAVQSIASSDTAVANAKNELGLRFIAQSGDVDASFITHVAVNAANGDIRNAWRFALWVDTDGNGNVDTVLQAGVSPGADGVVRFDNLDGGGYVVPAGSVTAFEVRFDVQSSLLPDRTMQLILNDIKAEEVRTGAPVGRLDVTQLSASTLWTFVKQGDLVVTNSVMPVPGRQLLGGTLSDPLMMLEVRSVNELIDVFKLGFQSKGSYATSVDRLELYKAGATSPFAIATLAGTGSDPVPAGSSVFTANMQSRQLVVSEGETLTILVRARIKADVQGGISGEKIQFELSRVEARGDQSSSNLLQNDGDNVREGEVFIGTNAAGPNAPVVSPMHVVTMSKIATIANANPDPDNTQIAVGTTSTIGQFKLTAAANANGMNGLNRMVLDKVIFTLQVKDLVMNTGSFVLQNNANLSAFAGGMLRDANGNGLPQGNTLLNGTYYLEFNGLSSFPAISEIASGQSLTLTILGKTVAANSGSELQLSFDGFSNSLATSFGWNASHVRWLDMDVTSTPFYGFEYATSAVRSTKYRN